MELKRIVERTPRLTPEEAIATSDALARAHDEYVENKLRAKGLL